MNNLNAPARRKTKKVWVGHVGIGGDAPISIQSMTNTKTADYHSTGRQIAELAAAGCELVRVAIPDEQAVQVLPLIIEQSVLPVIADIHFDYRLAIAAIEKGAAEIRINPGNIGGKNKLIALTRRAADAGIPLRIGVNAGSLEKKLLEKYRHKPAEALVDSACGYLDTLEAVGFFMTIVSLKSSDVYTTISANRLFAQQADYPLHIGVTEAGTEQTGTIKAAIGIGALLAEGIGDTFRVSLTAPPVSEIEVARSILQALGLRYFKAELVSCPTCGRCETDLISLTREVERLLKDVHKPLRVAVMGCAVNGPGEAKGADLGICIGKKQGLLFKKGKVVKTVALDRLLITLQEELHAEQAD